MEPQPQIFDQWLDDTWSTGPIDTSSDMWTNYICSPSSELDAQNFQDSYNMFSSPPPFELPSPISDFSSSGVEDIFGSTQPIDWDLFAATNNSIDSPAVLSPSSQSSRSSSPRSPPASRKSAKTAKPEGVRKSSSSSASKCGRTTHNLIEKKYRTNLNTKITCLRDAIPALSQSRSETSEDDEENRPMKINKGVILEKAIDYIKDLEEKNRSQEKEMAKLRRIAYETRNSYAAFSELRRKGMLGARGY